MFLVVFVCLLVEECCVQIVGIVPFKKNSVNVLGQFEFATFPESLQIVAVTTPLVF